MVEEGDPPAEGVEEMVPISQVFEMKRMMEAMAKMMVDMEARLPARISLPIPSSSTGSAASPACSPVSDNFRPHDEQKAVEKIVRSIGHIKFEPTSEVHYDDTLDHWEQISRSITPDMTCLKRVMLSMGGPIIQEAYEAVNADTLSWNECRDNIAKTLFPYALSVQEVELQLLKEERPENLNQTIAGLHSLFRRHDRLCHRWRRVNTYTSERKKEILARKIPYSLIATCLIGPNLSVMSYDEFVSACRQAYAVLSVATKPAEKPRVNHVCLASESSSDSDSDPPMAMRLEPHTQFRRVAEDNTKCYNCQGRGHFARDCTEPKKRCVTCGKTGHDASRCIRVENPPGYGTDLVSHIRIMKKGLMQTIEKDPSKRKRFDEFIKTLQLFQEQEERMANKGKERRSVKRDEERLEAVQEFGEFPALPELPAFSFSPTVEIEAQPVDEAMTVGLSSLGTKALPNPFYIDITIFERKVAMLIDGGATVCTLALEDWLRIAEDDRSNLSQCLVDSNCLIGAQGCLSVRFVAEIPVSILREERLLRFFIGPGLHNLIGLDGQEAFSLEPRLKYKRVSLRTAGKEAWLPPSSHHVSPLCVGEVQTHSSLLSTIFFGALADQAIQKYVVALLRHYADIWENPTAGRCRLSPIQIHTGNARPIAQRPRRLPLSKRRAVQREVDDLLTAGAIQPSKSAWAAPIVVVSKPNGDVRLCIDYRLLNKVVRADAYPLPRIEDLLHQLEGSTWFTTLDLKSGFHQLPLSVESWEKTAFTTPDGLYEFRVLPFGLVIAPSVFQRTMTDLFSSLPDRRHVGIYLDDIVLFSRTCESHLLLLQQVLDCCRKARLFVNLSKSVFCADKIKYLGFIVSGGKLTPDPVQARSIEKMAVPRTVKALRGFLGFTGYFRRFIANYASITKPLTHLLQKEQRYDWSPECQVAFDRLQTALIQDELLLKLPQPNRMFTLDVDVSPVAVGAALLQREGETGKLLPVCFASKSLTIAELKWTKREIEAYAVVWGVTHFAVHLRTQPHFTIRTAHESVRWMWSTESRRLSRWAMMLQEYNFSLVCKQGTTQAYLEIFARDSDEPTETNAFLQRSAVSPCVFVVTPSSSSPCLNDCLLLSPSDLPFPTLLEFRKQQEEELQLTAMSKVRELLRRNPEGLWVTAQGRLYVPSPLRSAVLSYFHFGRVGGHQGVNRTFTRMAKLLWWPQLKAAIQQFALSCIACQRQRPAPQLHLEGELTSARVGQIVALDVFGPFDFQGKAMQLITMVDHFSRFAQVVALEVVTAETLWQAFFAAWICLLGCPDCVLTDNGSVFKAQLFQQRCESLGIRRHFALAYRPQSNGVVESFHQFLKKSIAVWMRLTQWGLDEMLASILFAYRATPHPSTGESPYFLLSGQDMVLPGFQSWHPTDADASLDKRFSVLAELRRDCLRRTMKEVDRRRMADQAHKEEEVFHVGDLILYSFHVHEKQAAGKIYGGKFSPNWSEPCRVVRSLKSAHYLYEVRSLWLDRGLVVVPRDRMRRIVRQVGSTAIDMAQYESLSSDKHFALRYVSPRELVSTFLPGREGNILQMTCVRLERSLRQWNVDQKTLEEQAKSGTSQKVAKKRCLLALE